MLTVGQTKQAIAAAAVAVSQNNLADDETVAVQAIYYATHNLDWEECVVLYRRHKYQINLMADVVVNTIANSPELRSIMQTVEPTYSL